MNQSQSATSSEETDQSALPYLVTRRHVHFTKEGRLQKWMGPAVRGLAAAMLKKRVCLQSLADQSSRWRYCTGCQHIVTCPYGQMIEPDPAPGAPVFTGQEQTARPVVLRMPFPMPTEVRPGERAWISIVSLGREAIRHTPALWEAITLAAADPTRGFDPLGTTCEVGNSEEVVCEDRIRLPAKVDEMPGSVPWVRVELTAPLILRGRDEAGRRVHLSEPTFADLLRASLRTLGHLFALYSKPLPADFAGLKAAAEDVPTIETRFTRFVQSRWSNRSRQSR